MAEDIAKLGLRVDSQGVKEGAEGLDRLAASAVRADSAATAAEAAAQALAASSRNVAAAATAEAKAIDTAANANRNSAAAATAAAAQQSKAAGAYSHYAAQLAYATKQTERFATTGKASEQAYQSALGSLSQLNRTVGAYSTTLTGANANIAKHGTTFNAAGLSAKQYAASMRLLPAQITDIVTSLASGQPAYLVAIQQGGQLRDSFGGFGQTLKALGSILTPTRLLLGGVAATTAIVTKAFLDGRKEGFEFNKALILSGNAAGETAGRMAESAARIDDIAGTQRNASAVLAELAASGRVAAEQLEGAALAAIQLERAAGIAASETVKSFIALGKSPADAVRKLNEQYHFLTASTYAQIRALEDQGRTAEAAALAQQSFQVALQERAGEVEKHLGTIPRLARAAGSGIKEMWDALMGIGREQTPQEMLREVEEKIKRLQNLPRVRGRENLLGEATSERDTLAAQIAAEEDAAKKRQEAAAKAEREIRDADIRRDALVRSRDQAQRDAEQRRRADSSASVAAIKRALGEEAAAYAQQQDLLEARRAAGLVGEDQYYAERRRLIAANAEGQRGALVAENKRLEEESDRVAALAASARAAADSLAGQGSSQYAKALEEANRATSEAQAIQLQNAERIKENLAAIAGLKREEATQDAVLGIQEQARLKNLTLGYQQARAAADEYLQSLIRQQDRQLAAQGAGRQQREFDSGRQQIDDRYQDQRQQVASDRRVAPDTAENRARFDQELALIDEFHGKALSAYEEYWSKLKAGEQDWTNGAKAAWADFLDDAQNTSASTYQAWSNGLRQGADALADFFLTGKLGWKNFANSVIAEILRIQAQQQLANLLNIGIAWLTPLREVQAAGTRIQPRAKGGPIEPNQDYLVGEDGPEIRRFSRPGWIVPNHQLKGGGGDINITMHNAPGADVATFWAMAQRLKKELQGEVSADAVRNRFAWGRT